MPRHRAVWFNSSRWLAPLLIVASVGHADGIGGDVGIATDNAFRGLSQSDHQVSPEGDLHYTSSGWFAGVTAEEVRRGAYDSLGADLIGYLGYQRRLGDNWSASVTARHYDYPGYEHRSYYDYDEGALSVSWRAFIVANVIASPNVYFADRQGHRGRGAAFTYEVAARLPLLEGFSANAGLGYSDINQEIGTGYAYGNLGISKQWRSVNFDLRYVGTDQTARHRFGPTAENRLLFSILYLF